MSLTLDQIYDITTAPPVVGRRYGADSVLDFGDESPHAEVGIQWESVTCGVTETTDNACVNPGVTALTAQPCPTWGTANPFAVYGLFTDSLGSRRPIADHEQLARERFAATEVYGLEAGMLAYLAASPSVIVPAPAPTSVVESVLITLGAIEASLANSVTQAERTIVMNAQHATLIGDHLVANGGVLRTKLGSKVAVIAPDTSGSIYGTGSWKAHRGPVDVLDGTSVAATAGTLPTANVNDSSIIVQRTYAIGTACDVVSAVVPAVV